MYFYLLGVYKYEPTHQIALLRVAPNASLSSVRGMQSSRARKKRAHLISKAKMQIHHIEY